MAEERIDEQQAMNETEAEFRRLLDEADEHLARSIALREATDESIRKARKALAKLASA